MTTPSAPADTALATRTPASSGARSAPAPPSWPWRRGALILAGTAQLITISDLVTPDHPLAATWWSLLLGIAPAPGARPPLERRLLAIAFADQVGATLASSHPAGQR